MNAIQKLNKEQSKELFFQLEIPLHILDTIATNQKGNLKERKGKEKGNVKSTMSRPGLTLTGVSWEKLVAGLRMIGLKLT